MVKDDVPSMFLPQLGYAHTNSTRIQQGPIACPSTYVVADMSAGLHHTPSTNVQPAENPTTTTHITRRCASHVLPSPVSMLCPQVFHPSQCPLSLLLVSPDRGLTLDSHLRASGDFVERKMIVARGRRRMACNSRAVVGVASAILKCCIEREASEQWRMRVVNRPAAFGRLKGNRS